MRRIKYLPLLIFCLVLHLQAQAQNGSKDKNVSISVEQAAVDNNFVVVATNKHPYSITLHLSVTGKNFETSASMPVTSVIPPFRKVDVLHLKRSDPAKAYNFYTHSSWFMGNVDARPDPNYAYRLPFRMGGSKMVVQGYGGSFSHTGDETYSIDFKMDVGTNVYAARGGRVADVKEDSDTGGTSKKFEPYANYIMIEQSDGTFAEYAHLQKNGAIVKPGDMVQRGQLIGYSGNTGYSSGPHLHFMVVKVGSDGSFHSIPVHFYTKRGVVAHLIEGVAYTAE